MRSECYLILSLCCFLTYNYMYFSGGIETTASIEPQGQYAYACLDENFEANCTSQTLIVGWNIMSPNSLVFTTSYFTFGLETSETVDDFVLTLVPADLLSSRAYLDITRSDHNGTLLICVSTAELPAPSVHAANITLIVQGPPSAPLNPVVFSESIHIVVLSWTQPDDILCVTGYTITLTNNTESLSFTYNVSSNTTNMTVSNLTQGAEYFFTVAGVDAKGRVGKYSVSSEVIMLDTPEEVTEVKSFVSSHVITIEWMPPTSSSRPPVIGYKISHNITGSDIVNFTTDTNFIVEFVASGIYCFAIKAVNALGDGKKYTFTETSTFLLDPAGTISFTNTSFATSTTKIHTTSYNQDTNSSLTFKSVIESYTLYTTLTEETPSFKELFSTTFAAIIASSSILAILITVFVLLSLVITLRRVIENRRTKKNSYSTRDQVTCSENAAYDSVSNSLKLAAQWTMTCSENVAYTATSEISSAITHSKQNAVYDEVKVVSS